jgi:8-oxo-dGTP pyrophosphatase MutT (NUDIX family)
MPKPPRQKDGYREPRQQYAALPWRRGEGGRVEVLLITSRETRRWVIPKGWPMKGKSSGESAALEAFEEAGVIGRLAAVPEGSYWYEKRLKSGRLQHVTVAVFALEVSSESDTYHELGQRVRQWFSPKDAAGLVDEPELSALLADFDPELEA